MKKSLCIMLILALVTAFALIVTPATPAAAPGGGVPARVSFPESDSEFVPGELLVRFRAGSSSSAVAKLKKGMGVSSAEKLGVLDIEKVQFSGRSIEEALGLVQKSNVVVSASPNYIRRLHYAPNDTLFPQQWNFQQATGGVNMPGAWDIVQGGDPSVIVAIVDSGVAYETANGYTQAPDLALTNFVQGYNFINNTPFADDDNGHGTHVCGTIAQSTNNALGCAGIAFKCTIMPVKVMNQQGTGTDSDILQGVDFASKHGAKVINMSLGGPDADPTLEETINLAVANGTVVCASTGNDGRAAADYPAGFPSVIAVGATRRDTAIASYSNYNDPLQVDAPGGDGSTGDFIYQQTYRQKEHPFGPAPIFAYMGYTGTSMACPHVAAEAALIRTLHPDWTVNDVRADITSTARSIGPANLYGYGLIDVQAALAAPRPSSLFYFAEGTVRPNFETYLCIQNPGDIDATVSITYMKGDGNTVPQPLTVPKNARSTVRVKDVLGEANDAAHDFSTKVECTNEQRIIAERPMYFNYVGNGTVNWNGGHDVMGITAPSTTYYFAEGTCRPNFDPYLCIQNPNDTGASITITYMKGDGTTAQQQLSVAKNSRSTVRVKDQLGEANDNAHDFSSKVDCTNGLRIIAERPMYFNYQGSGNVNWTGGHDVMGATLPSTTFYFAEGTVRPNFETYFCIQNPNPTAAQVFLVYIKGNGSQDQQEISVQPNSRYTVRVKDVLGEGDDIAHDFSTGVICTSGQAIIVERPMYFNYSSVWTGGHDVMGATSPQASFYFAEGSCRPNFDPYICILNGGDLAANVTITYMKGDGTTKQQSLSVPASTRSTVRVTDTLGVGNDPAHDFSASVECTNGELILAERPMYFDYLGSSNLNWTGGHDVVGFTP